MNLRVSYPVMYIPLLRLDQNQIFSGKLCRTLWGEREQAASTIRESVDSLCRDGADAQCMQYLSKNSITLPPIR